MCHVFYGLVPGACGLASLANNREDIGVEQGIELSTFCQTLSTLKPRVCGKKWYGTNFETFQSARGWSHFGGPE